MSCFFCDSNFHVSHFCDKYVTNESRRDRATSKKCCPNCFLKSESWCSKCQYRRECYVCFSKYHETVFCPHVMKEPTVFPPKIDEDLLPRFYGFLNVAEKWSLISTFPNLSNSVNLKPIRVTFRHNFSLSNNENYSNFDVMSIHKISHKNAISPFFSNDTFSVESNRLLPIKPPIFYVKQIELGGVLFLSQELMLLLTQKTCNVQFTGTNFYPILTFSEILRKAPFLSEIQLTNTNIELPDSWPDDVQNLNESEQFSMYLTLRKFDINLESLVSLLKSSTKRSAFILDFDLIWDKNQDAIIAEARNELLKYFLPSERQKSSCLMISLRIPLGKQSYQKNVTSEYYSLKEENNIGEEK